MIRSFMEILNSLGTRRYASTQTPVKYHQPPKFSLPITGPSGIPTLPGSMSNRLHRTTYHRGHNV